MRILAALLAQTAFARLLRTESSATTRVHAGVTVRLHTKARASTTLRAGGSAPSDILYASLKVGSPEQEFLVAIDTSSGHLILPSKDCTSQGCLSHRYYDATLSTSGHALATLDNLSEEGGPKETVSFSFARGSITGTFAKDNVCMGSLCVPMHFIEAIRMSDEPFSLVPYDGVLGLGMPQLSTTKDFNFIGQLAGDGALKHTQFAIWLARHGYHGEGDDEDSELVLGDFNRDRLASEVVWSTISTQPGQPSSGFWQITVKDLAVGGDQLEVCGTSGCQAVVDTSTTAIGLPQDKFDLLAGQTEVRSDCSNFASLPRIGFVIGGYMLNLRPHDYVLRSANGANCQSLLYPLNVIKPKGPLILLGTPFLTAFYSIYDRETLKVGLALATHKHTKAEEVPELFLRMPR